jgi:hypothetical protein
MSAMTRTARRGRLSATALAFAVAVLWAGPAQAGTPIQLGQLSQGDPGTCGIVTNLVQAAVAGPPSYTVPSDGVITSWSHRGNDIAPGTGRLQLWRPAGGTNYTLVGRSEIEAFVAGVVDTFATDIPVSTGDVLGFRSDTAGTGCTGAGGVGDVVRFDGANTSDPPPGVMRDMSSPSDGIRLNVSATFEPADPPGPASATKGKQSANKLKIKLTVDQDSTLNLGGKAAVAQRVLASTTAKAKKYKLKKKKGIGLQAGVEKVIGLKFKNNRKTLKRIKKLQKRSKKARRNSKVIVNLTLTTTTGVVSDTKLKIKLKA